MTTKIKDMQATVVKVGGRHRYESVTGRTHRMCLVTVESTGGEKISAFAWGAFTAVEPGDVVRITLTGPTWDSDKEYLVSGVLQSKQSWLRS